MQIGFGKLFLSSKLVHSIHKPEPTDLQSVGESLPADCKSAGASAGASTGASRGKG